MRALGRGQGRPTVGRTVLSVLGLVAFLVGRATGTEAAVMCPADAAGVRAAVAAGAPLALAGAATGAAIGGPRVRADAGPKGDADSVAGFLRRAEALQRRGHHWRAIEVLRDGLAHAEAAGDRGAIAALSGSLGSAYLAAGASRPARLALERSLEIARGAGLARVEAVTLTNLANLLAAEGEPEAALAAYDRSVQRALAEEWAALAARSSINAARLLAQRGEHDAAEERVRLALRELERTPADADQALDLVAIGLLLRDLDLALAIPDGNGALLAHGLLTRAAGMAGAAGDARTESYALGHLGRLYEDAGRVEDALPLTRRALFLAQTVDAPEALYLWQWQIGRLLAAKGDRGAAIAAYQGAVRTLQSIRVDLPAFDPETGRSLFRETVGPVFLGLADLLLAEAAEVGAGGAAQPYLIEARTTVERLKAAELEDYFQDDCVAVLQSRIRPIDRLDERTAALYPIILPDRTELLLSLPDGLAHITVPVSAEILNDEVRALRRLLEKVTTRQYLPRAQRLYDRLIRPIEVHLAMAGIDTLVFIPDGALRTVPLAALHDGEMFLAERYAVATAPGLSLLDPQPVARGGEARVLLGGLTEAVQGFAPLPHVAAELERLQELLGGTVLKDEGFVTERVEESLEATPYSVVHIASHGRFAGDPEDSFVLTFDGRLDMDELEALIEPSRFRDQPVELLTLSACRTAAGDDRAALGLAGVAVKAGARSALASLWYINDPASSALVVEFYRGLRDPALSKAQALRRAQLALLSDPRYRHPGYWSPFLIIGNWL